MRGRNTFVGRSSNLPNTLLRQTIEQGLSLKRSTKTLPRAEARCSASPSCRLRRRRPGATKHFPTRNPGHLWYRDFAAFRGVATWGAGHHQRALSPEAAISALPIHVL